VNKLLGPEELSEVLGVPVGTLYQWRHRQQGPPALKLGRHLRWRLEDVELWLTDQLDRGTRGENDCEPMPFIGANGSS